MKRIGIFSLLCCCFIGSASALEKPSFGPDKSQMLGGDEGDACTIKMCLSDPMGSDMEECKASLKRYFRMDPEDRPGFLAKCPMVTGGSGGS